MDGVLIDSEPWWREAMAEVYARAGIPYSAQQAVKTQGMRIGDIARKTLEEHPMEGWDARRLEESVSAAAPAPAGLEVRWIVDAGHGGEDGGAVSPGGVVESRINGIPAQFYREQYAITFEKEFADRSKYPDRNACLSYEERYLSDILMRHPGTYFLLFFNPSKLVPDVPTFLENLKLTTGGRGTWDVIIKDGLFAGIRHYFNGKLHLPFLLTPLILLLLATYLGAFFEVVNALVKKEWMTPLLFLLFCVFYLMVVGPGGYPRFQLPALPFLCLLCGRAADRILSLRESRRKDGLKSERKNERSEAS